MKPRTYVIIVIAGILLAIIFFLNDLLRKSDILPKTRPLTPQEEKSSPSSQSSITLGGPFKLTDQHGRMRSDKDFRGKYMIVYFGYSFCPDVCPEALENITQALNQLEDRERKKFVPIFITLDPERDTVTSLKTYIQEFHQDYIALTGSQKEIDKVLKLYKVYARKERPNDTVADYLVDHSSVVYVMDPQGRFKTSFNHKTSPAQVVRILQNTIEQ